jgi:phage terminase small subunit
MKALSAIRAGYSEGNAHVTSSRLMKKPEVKAMIAERMKARAERTEITQDYVLKVLHETTERCRQTVSPIIDKQGNAVLTKNREGELVAAFKFDAFGALKGAELMGKHLGMFVDKVEHTGKDGGPIETRNVGDLTDDELLDIATGSSTGTADPATRTH